MLAFVIFNIFLEHLYICNIFTFILSLFYLTKTVLAILVSVVVLVNNNNITTIEILLEHNRSVNCR